jgi:hypothetical protein
MTSQAFSADELRLVAALCERFRRAIEVEAENVPITRQPLNNVYINLAIARDMLHGVANDIERYQTDQQQPTASPLSPEAQ